MKPFYIVKMSCQGAAWYLLNFHMSELLRKRQYIPTKWLQKRQSVRKNLARIEDNGLDKDLTDVWCENLIENNKSLTEALTDVTIAQFTALWYKVKKNGSVVPYRKPLTTLITKQRKKTTIDANSVYCSTARTASQRRNQLARPALLSSVL